MEEEYMKLYVELMRTQLDWDEEKKLTHPDSLIKDLLDGGLE